MSYKVGISGLRRGMSLARVFPLLADCSVVAGCDPSAAAQAAFTAAFPDAEVYTDYVGMLASGLDIVAVATPVPQHAEQTIAALDAGCHVLQEVYLADTVERCRSIYEAVQAHPQQKFMLAENCCYWAHIMSWKKLFREGQLGALTYGEAEYVHDVRSLTYRDGKPTWRATLPPIHYCTHSLGPLLSITGTRCVTAVGMATPSRLDPGPEHWDMEVGLFRTEDGATIKILTGFRVLREPAFHYYSLYGSRGCLETARPPQALSTHAYLDSVPHLQGMMSLPLGLDVPRAPAGAGVGGHGTAEFYMVKEFVEAIRQDRAPALDIHAALDMSLPGLCAHASALNGSAPVAVPDWR
jgi:predicted dehydrogenase